MDLKQAKSIHLIGIGGTGLSAIARLLLESGYQVSGSDRQLSPLAESLRQVGVKVFIGHQPENVRGSDLVVRSSAVADDNVEVRAALAAGIPVLKRSDFLGKLMEGHLGIAVAGTHGKTTTTAMIAWMLTALQQDPSFIVGGVPINLGVNARAGKGKAFVIEADEYDRMFLGLSPRIAVVTNIEHDHPDCFPTAEDFYQAFREFSTRLTRDGVLLACREDPGALRLLKDAAGRGQKALAYGIRQDQRVPTGVLMAYQADNLVRNKYGSFTFDALCIQPGVEFALRPAVTLQVPGEHNVLNALAAMAVAHQAGLPVEAAGQALSSYRGTGRRFEIMGEASGVTVVSDYAHHPTEIRTTLRAARSYFPGRTIWALWQPHTYSRTRTLAGGFSRAFEQADHVIVTEVYASREAQPEDGFSAHDVVADMQHADAHYVPDLNQATEFLLGRLQAGDVLLVLSAGDADQVGENVLAALQERSQTNV